MGAFDKGNILKEKLKTDLTTSMSETQPSFIPVINSAVDICFEYVNKKPVEGANQQNGKKCDKISSIMLLCTRLQMIKVSLMK